MTDDQQIGVIAEQLVREFGKAGLTVTTAESCTGGMIGAAITSVAGSSAIYECGFVTYSNEAKSKLIGVDPELVKENGAVSAQTASAMAIGALVTSGAAASVAVTGIAGPDGGTAEKPVGTVFIAVATSNDEGAFVEKFEFGNIGREQTRLAATREALEMLLGYGLDDAEETIA